MIVRTRRCDMNEVNAVGRTQDHAFVRTLMVLVLILFVACDPGMTVRQIDSSVESEGATTTTTPKISVDVKTTDQLIGERSYRPRVTLTNSSDFTITITEVDLNAQGAIYKNRPYDAKYYPLRVPPQSTVPLDVYFRFAEGIYKIFKDPCELRIHYSSQQGTALARITVAGGPLTAK